jgi:hypothetical protein
MSDLLSGAASSSSSSSSDVTQNAADKKDWGKGQGLKGLKGAFGAKHKVVRIASSSSRSHLQEKGGLQEKGSLQEAAEGSSSQGQAPAAGKKRGSEVLEEGQQPAAAESNARSRSRRSSKCSSDGEDSDTHAFEFTPQLEAQCLTAMLAAAAEAADAVHDGSEATVAAAVEAAINKYCLADFTDEDRAEFAGGGIAHVVEQMARAKAGSSSSSEGSRTAATASEHLWGKRARAIIAAAAEAMNTAQDGSAESVADAAAAAMMKHCAGSYPMPAHPELAEIAAASNTDPQQQQQSAKQQQQQQEEQGKQQAQQQQQQQQKAAEEDDESGCTSSAGDDDDKPMCERFVFGSSSDAQVRSTPLHAVLLKEPHKVGAACWLYPLLAAAAVCPAST